MTNDRAMSKQLVEQYPWFVGARLVASSAGEQVAESYLLASRLRRQLVGNLAVLKSISAEEFGLSFEEVSPIITTDGADDSTLSLIDSFISGGDHRRIVVVESTTEESMAVFGDEDEADDEFVSEDLAEIYAKQGLFDDAIKIYRKLSLQDSQKSIYFAELIGRLEQTAERQAKNNDK